MRSEAARHELINSHLARLAIWHHRGHDTVDSKLSKRLATHAARLSREVSLSRHDAMLELEARALSCNRLTDGVPFGANSHWVRCVLNVAAGVNLTACGQDGGADFEFGVRRVRILSNFPGGIDQRLKIHIALDRQRNSEP